MGRKGESIFKRSDGRFEGRYIKEYKEGKAIYGYVYAKTYNECKKKKNMQLIAKKDDNKIITSKSSKTLNHLINEWLESKEKIKSSSYKRYYDLIQQHLKNDIGKIRINNLNSKVVNKYINNKLQNGRLDKTGGLSHNTVYDICNILKQVFKDNNIEIDMIKVSKKVGVGKSLYSNEKDNLIEKLNNINTEVSLGILLSLMLGIRESEVCGIRWCDIDLKNKIIQINHIVSRVKSFNTRNKTKLILSTPKTEESKRILPIPDKIYDKLLTFKSKHNSDCFLLTGKTNFMDPRTFYNKYKRILDVIELDYTFHDLRHTFATNCIDIGIDYKSLMELLGHSNITTTMNIYVHPTMNTKRNFINKL